MGALMFSELLAATWVACTHGLKIPIGTQYPGTIAFYQLGGKCGTGEPAYYGYLEPATLTSDAIFLEMMGGAVCFNQASCKDDWLSAWMNITYFLSEKLKASAEEISYLKSGAPLPLGSFENITQKAAGWLPVDASHPLYGRRGVYYPTCTGDIMMGRHTLTYEDGYIAHHHGAKNMRKVLDALKAGLPNATEITVYGGSGAGVSTSLWMTEIADIWPKAQVSALVDSGFHMMPGSKFFEFFYNNVQWSVGPGGDNAGKMKDVKVPRWEWLEEAGISNELTRYNGRIKIAYIACEMDSTVLSDRDRMSKYSEFSGKTIDQLREMWCFLTHLHRDAPKGTAFSYIANCANHHLTRHGFPETANLYNEITLKTFTENFLLGKAPDENATNRSTFWYSAHNTSVCNTMVEGPKPKCTGEECDTMDTDAAVGALGLPSLSSVAALVLLLQLW